MKTCPACAEEISPAVRTCPHCGISLADYGLLGGRSGAKNSSSNMMIVLIVMGCALGFVMVCGGILAALLLPAVQQAREAARRTECKSHLRQIGLALHTYHDVYQCFPPAYVADASGKPMHSWRVLILPFVDALPLYKEYDFSEPWDGPNNSRLLGRMPSIYACPSQALASATSNTAYAGLFGENCIFRGTEPVGIVDITDGASNTLMLTEASGANIPWMKPEDIDLAKHPALGDQDGISSRHANGVNALMADVSVLFLPLSISPASLKTLSTINGGEPRPTDF